MGKALFRIFLKWQGEYVVWWHNIMELRKHHWYDKLAACKSSGGINDWVMVFIKTYRHRKTLND